MTRGMIVMRILKYSAYFIMTKLWTVDCCRQVYSLEVEGWRLKDGG
jgi:hypothetical protein